MKATYGGSHVILVSFLFDHCLGRRAAWFLKYRWRRGWDSKNFVWGIPGLVPRLTIPWTAGCLRPVYVRVAINRHSNHINSPIDSLNMDHHQVVGLAFQWAINISYRKTTYSTKSRNK